LDRRADVFCLGIVLWEMLTGRHLFKRESDAASVTAILAGVVPPPSNYTSGIDPAIEHVVMKALAPRREDRFQTAGEMDDALERHFATVSLRPSPKSIGVWLEGLFGADRAQAKRAIAEGRDLAQAVPQVMTLHTPTNARLTTQGSQSIHTLASTPHRRIGESAPPRPLHLRRRVARTCAFAAYAIAAGVCAATVGERLSQASAPVTRPDPRGSIRVESDPPGAFIFLGGEPTGLVTPAVLSGLATGASLTVRIEKSGYAPWEERVRVAAGQPTPIRGALQRVLGTVHVKLSRSDARLWVNGAPASSNELENLPPGSYELKMVVGKKVIETRRVDVQAGVQTVTLGR
jgi:serine/threonine-protein kinase